VIVTEVREDSPAAVAGLLPGDVITHLGNQPVRSRQILEQVLGGLDPERGGMFLLLREGTKAFALIKP